MIKEIKNIFIIGNKGAMGTFFEKRFKDIQEISVLGMDQPIDKNLMRSCLETAHMILLCIPIGAMYEITSLIAECTSNLPILVDICSVKVKPMDIMLRKYTGPVVGTHPLFGPNPHKDLPLKMAMIRGRGNEEFDLVNQFFEKLGFVTFECTAKEHDYAMAYIQGLNFVTTLSYFASCAGDESILKFITPSFERRIEAASKMLTEDANLFQTLFESNPFSHEAVKRFRSFLNLASAGDLELLVQKAWWWWNENHKGGGVP